MNTILNWVCMIVALLFTGVVATFFIVLNYIKIKCKEDKEGKNENS